MVTRVSSNTTSLQFVLIESIDRALRFMTMLFALLTSIHFVVRFLADKTSRHPNLKFPTQLEVPGAKREVSVRPQISPYRETSGMAALLLWVRVSYWTALQSSLRFFLPRRGTVAA
jgi:hypothetical protein